MSDGWQFNSEAVNRAIMAYIEDWFAGNIPDEVETKRREIEEIRKQTEANRQHSRPTWKHG
jgi:hypothetical protein